MEPYEIIKHINRHHLDYWKVKIPKYLAFDELLRPDFEALNESDYSRLRSATERCPKVEPALNIPRVGARIEAKLALPGLFRCKTGSEIDELIGRARPGPAQGAAAASVDVGLIISKGQDLDDIALCANEERVVDRLIPFLDRRDEGLGQWREPPRFGASLIAYVAAGRRAGKEGGENYLALPFADASAKYLQGTRPDPSHIPYDCALGSLKRSLKLEQHSTPHDVLERLIELGRTLFVVHPEVLESEGGDRNSAMHRLVKEAERRCPTRPRKCIPVMLLGKSSSGRIAKQTWTFEGEATRTLEFDPPQHREREQFFETQWRRFCRLRGMERDAEAGSSRLKRGHRYYSSDTASSSLPSTLRIQAFFASNHETFSYFDPTAGWTRLAGMPLSELPIDMGLHLSEAVHLLRNIPEDGKRLPQLKALRWCSTAVYWLTTDAVVDLGRLRPTMKLVTFDSSIDKQLVEIETSSDGGTIYKMDLGLRAAIQNRWMHMDCYKRASAHHHIAARLFAAKDNKALLGSEFPLQPHWGRSRLHFLAECIRHLVRACEFSRRSEAPVPEIDEAEFPDKPTKELNGCDARQVVNYCFGQLFWRELNGQRKNTNQLNRKLALQHGVYHLTAELLQLMSDENQLGKPHWALRHEYVHRYLLEVAFAQLDLGDLKGSKATFDELITRSQGDGGDPFDVIDYQLDLTIVLASMDDLKATRATLDDACRRLEDLRSTASPTGDRIEHLLNRINARRAHIEYLEGNFLGALAVCQQIEKTTPEALVRDAAHVYISTLGALDNVAENLQSAMRICVRQVFENTSRGLHHEALGFRVALAHLFRKLNHLEAAEETLDGAYRDVLQYGCAERVYISMLLEAGRILYYQGRHERAYAAYLRPCLVRSRSRHYARTAKHARHYAQLCLENLLNRVPAGGWESEVVAERLKPRGRYLEGPSAGGIDPMHSYDPAEVVRWIPRLRSHDALVIELSTLDRN